MLFPLEKLLRQETYLKHVFQIDIRLKIFNTIAKNALLELHYLVGLMLMHNLNF